MKSKKPVLTYRRGKIHRGVGYWGLCSATVYGEYPRKAGTNGRYEESKIRMRRKAYANGLALVTEE